MEKTFECEAKIENLGKANAFLEETLEEVGCGMKQSMQLSVALEEIFVNIAHYAYAEADSSGNIIPDTGSGRVRLTLVAEDGKVFMTFEDEGVPYNPLEKDDPDVTLSVNDREIGGLGIFMVKKSMDDMKYEHKDGKNILTLMKKL
ncbi:Anti-sigma regulatory factor (Ser/Thr protein kinase) [Pseudobutyrivibrio sp. OR37]|uniref:ATP-binding protein n=1 Tax=Pseudobutyrivibrio sp. OR37 TaxID=1798186 RepID=UPI0008F45419|nr:ATP-binding protein [Pseudobutyrivibrio sp. OR37]SFI22576.1 Anti-sigma regulatory factor (Ser/Thr protein kinase) [Pseudobutyrivibrio sp. OR37]